MSILCNITIKKDNKKEKINVFDYIDTCHYLTQLDTIKEFKFFNFRLRKPHKASPRREASSGQPAPGAALRPAALLPPRTGTVCTRNKT